MERKNTTWELRKAYTSFNSQINQAEKKMSEIEDQLNEIKQKARLEKKKKEMNKASKKYQIMWKHLIYVS